MDTNLQQPHTIPAHHLAAGEALANLIETIRCTAKINNQKGITEEESSWVAATIINAIRDSLDQEELDRAATNIRSALELKNAAHLEIGSPYEERFN